MRSVDERTSDLNTTIREAMDNVSSNTRVSSPGIVTGYNPIAGTVSVQLSVREKVNSNGTTQDVNVPMLVDVPLCMPRGSKYMLASTPTIGDEVLVVFGDRCIDSWWQSGGVQNQADSRKHDLSDGFAILGPWSQKERPDLGTMPLEGVRLQNADAGAHVWLKEGSTIVISAAGGINNYGQVLIQGEDETVYIKFNGHDIEVKCENLKVETTGNISLDAESNISIHAQSDIAIESESSMFITAPEISLHGTVLVNGNDIEQHVHASPHGGYTGVMTYA